MKTADMQVQSDGIYLRGAPPQLWLYRCQVWLGGALLLCMLTLGIRSCQQGLLIFLLLGVLALAGGGWLRQWQKKLRPVLRQQGADWLLDLSARAPSEELLRLHLPDYVRLELGAGRDWLYLVRADGQVQAQPLVTAINGSLVHWGDALAQFAQQQAAALQLLGLRVQLGASANESTHESAHESADESVGESSPKFSPSAPALGGPSWLDRLLGRLRITDSGLYSGSIPAKALLSGEALPGKRTPAWSQLAYAPRDVFWMGLLWLVGAALLQLGRSAPGLGQLWQLPVQGLSDIASLLWGGAYWLIGLPLLWALLLQVFFMNHGILRQLRQKLFPQGFPLLELRDGVLTVADVAGVSSGQRLRMADIATVHVLAAQRLGNVQTLELLVRGHAGWRQRLELKLPASVLGNGGREKLVQLLRRHWGEQVQEQVSEARQAVLA